MLADWGIAYADDANLEQSAAPLYKIELLGKTFYFTDPDAHPDLSELHPIILLPENRPDNITLFDKHHPDVAIKAVIGDGSQTIPVPIGDYEVVQKLPGRPPAITNVTVPPGGTTLPLSVPKPTIASLTLDATPRPTGFLDPGSQIRFTVVAKDANGNVIPNDQIDLTCLKPQVFNPVGLSGSTVGTMGSPQFAIDSNTGQLTATLTIGQANGAARVSARTCDGVTSNSILISGLGFELFNVPIISFDSTELSIVEGSGGGTKDLLIPLSINKLGSGPVSVGFNTQDRGAAGVPASATSGKDYTSSVGTVKFTGLHATIKVPIVKDNITELNEQFVVGLLNPVNARLNIKNTAVCTILDDDPAQLSIADVKKNEGNSGTTNFVFTVKLSNPNSQAVTVDYATADGSASQSSDYTPTSGTLTFQPGETSKSITVAVHGDLDIENDETFFVNLSNLNPVTVSLSNNQAIGTIVNDDRLRPGQVVIKIVGNGFVTDSTGQIDTRLGHNMATYGSNDFPFLHASSPFVEWSDPSFFTQDPPLTPSDFANGLILTATFP